MERRFITPGVREADHSLKSARETAGNIRPIFEEEKVYYIDRCVGWGEYVALSAENIGSQKATFYSRKGAEEWIKANRPGGGYIVREEWINVRLHYD